MSDWEEHDSTQDVSVSRESYAEWKEGRSEVVGDSDATRVLRGFELKNLSHVEREEGTPEARIVELKFDIDIPARVLEIGSGF